MTNEPSNENPDTPSDNLALGSMVRVKKGVRDPNYPDIPLTGWVGEVVDTNSSQQPHLRLVRWNEETLAKMHPVCRVRCQRDDLDFDAMWLEVDELEAYDGSPVEPEQPTEIVGRPLDPEDPEDRIRELFGLTGDHPLPTLDEESLERYRQILVDRLSLPFPALFTQEGFSRGHIEPVLVLRLLPAEDEEGLRVECRRGEEEIIFPLTELDLPEEDRNYQLLEDYCYWLDAVLEEEEGEHSETGLIPFRQGTDSRFEPGFFLPFPEPGADTSPWASLRSFLTFTVYLAGVGSVVGAVLWAHEGAFTVIGVVAAIFGSIGMLLGGGYGRIMSSVGFRAMPYFLGVFGALFGVALGSVVGAVVLAFAGSIPGSILGYCLSSLFQLLGWRILNKFLWTLLGAMAGALTLVLYTNTQEALTGALYGSVVGAVGGVLSVLLFLVGLFLMLGRRGN